jgi:hypothetical protein
MIEFGEEFEESSEMLMIIYATTEAKLIHYEKTGIFEKYTFVNGKEKTEVLKGDELNKYLMDTYKFQNKILKTLLARK